MAGTEVALRPEQQATHGLELAERIFTPNRRKAIAKFLDISPENAALIPYLAVCASWGLDPVMGQIWLIPQKKRGQDGEEAETKYRPAVGRDGFLAVARRDQMYRGIRYGVVCERDTFEVVDDETDTRVRILPWGWPDLPIVMHRLASKPVAFDPADNPARWRGRVLGAWAKCYVEGQPPTYYYAPIQEHVKMREKWTGPRGHRSPVLDANGNRTLEPEGAWSYVSTMILKSAQSYVLRIAMGITGVVPVDELREQGSVEGGSIDAEAIEEEQEAVVFDFSGLPGDTDRLREAVERVNELAPMSWAPAKLEMVTAGMDAAAVEDLAGRIEAEAEILGARAAERSAAGRSEEPEGGSSSEPDAPAEGLTEPQGEEPVADAELVGEELTPLEFRKAGLEDRLNEPDLSEQDRAELNDELALVERQIAAGQDPDQERLV